MKINKILMTAVAIAAVSCSSAEKNSTVISGSFDPATTPESVHIVISQLGIDTLVAVNAEKSNFSFSTVVNPMVYGTVESKFGNVRFVADGSAVNVDFTGETPVLSSPDSASVNNIAKRYHAWQETFMKDYSALRTSLMSDTSLKDEQKQEQLEAKYEEYVAYNKEVTAQNAANAVGVEAFKAVYYEYATDEAIKVLESFGEYVAIDKELTKMRASLDAKVKTAEGTKFVDFTVDQGDGKEVKLSDYVGKGKYVLVDFWASWCGPCKREIPTIKEVYNKYKGADFDVLSVAVWDNPEDTKAAAKALGVNWNQIINAQKEPTELYGIEGIPHIILFGPDGTILKRDLRGEAIEAEVSKYIKK